MAKENWNFPKAIYSQEIGLLTLLLEMAPLSIPKAKFTKETLLTFINKDKENLYLQMAITTRDNSERDKSLVMGL